MAEKPKLQDYADAHCNGDRQRAIFDLYLSDYKGDGLDPYLHDMTTEDKLFVTSIFPLVRLGFYQSKEDLTKVATAEKYAARLGTSLHRARTSTENPFIKIFFKKLGRNFCVSCILALLFYFMRKNGMFVGMFDIFIVGVVILTLRILSKGVDNFRDIFRYKKIQEYAPLELQLNPKPVMPTFEECRAYHQQKISVMEQITGAIKVVKSRHTVAFCCWLPIFMILFFVENGRAVSTPIAAACYICGYWGIFIVMFGLFRGWQKIRRLIRNLSPIDPSVEQIERGCEGVRVITSIAAGFYVFQLFLFIGNLLYRLVLS